ncbi:MAG: OmpA family protein [Gemmatimonadota bacterium]
MTTIPKYMGVALGVLAMGACATKGYVRTQVQAATDSSRAAWIAADNAAKGELASQMSTQSSRSEAAVDSVRRDVASLRQDLNLLRDSLGAKIVAMENGMKFVLPVHFAFDDANVRSEDRGSLDLFAKVVNRHYGGSLVTVEGFADPSGSAAYNKRLSEERAEKVVAYLQQGGISGVTLRAVGMGKTRLVAKGASHDMPGAELNRRVVFVVETGPQSAPVTQ